MADLRLMRELPYSKLGLDDARDGRPRVGTLDAVNTLGALRRPDRFANMPSRLSEGDFDALELDSPPEGCGGCEGCHRCDLHERWRFEGGLVVGAVCFNTCREWWAWVLFSRTHARYRCTEFGYGQTSCVMAREALFAAAAAAAAAEDT